MQVETRNVKFAGHKVLKTARGELPNTAALNSPKTRHYKLQITNTSRAND